MQYSENWVTWQTNIGPTTCTECLLRNKKIYYLDDLIRKHEPPLHLNCKCACKPIGVILAGTATMLGTNGADWWIKYLHELPQYYITRDQAKKLGWVAWKGNLGEVLPGYMLYGGVYKNRKGILPEKEGRIWYEADINYVGGYRNYERIVFSNDGLIFVTYDHYSTFAEIIGEEN